MTMHRLVDACEPLPLRLSKDNCCTPIPIQPEHLKLRAEQLGMQGRLAWQGGIKKPQYGHEQGDL